METKELLDKINYNNKPVGLGGCKNHPYSYDCCEYNVTIFDDTKKSDELLSLNDDIIRIHHGTLSELNSDILTNYDSMQILYDEQWELRMFLDKIQKNKEKLFLNHAKSCLIESLFCVSKARDAIKNSDLFSSCWIKSSAFFLADAISLLNMQRSSPAHFLHIIRNLENSDINKKLSTVTDCIGIERATSSVLERMCKSTIGFSDMIESTSSSIIQKKYDYMIDNSLLTDCYFYLGYVTRNNMIGLKSSLQRKPELIHILKTAFDIEGNISVLENQAKLLHTTVNEILVQINQK